jgi:hypothetical protein
MPFCLTDVVEVRSYKQVARPSPPPPLY